MPSIVRIERADKLPLVDMQLLLSESESEKHRMLRRLVEDWKSGTNRFDKLGEGLFVARAEGRIVGICGLNQDPYTQDPLIGRVRHLYVSTSWRRRGVGRRLVGEVIRAARLRFRNLRLRTGETGAEQFYAALGFAKVEGDDYCSYALELEGS